MSWYAYSMDSTYPLSEMINYLQHKNKILFLTTSNRWSGGKNPEQPKSTQLAHAIAQNIGNEKVRVLDVSALNIATCEGNVSTRNGNTCGVVKATLNDPQRNPTGHLRCWASINNPDDELWKVSSALLASDCVVFFGSVRWGQMNSIYQKLIERLTWLENRHSTLGESNVLEHIDAGIVAIGHNWNGAQVVQTQKQVLSMYGFAVQDTLCWSWAFTTPEDESNTSYTKAADAFQELLTML